MRNRSLLWTFFLPLLSLLVASLLLVAGFSGGAMRAFLIEQTEQNLNETAVLLLPRLEPLVAAGDEEAVQAVCLEVTTAGTMRLTVVARDGRVLGDSHDNPAAMENHADREEIARALVGEVASTTRYSSTLGHQRKYVAVPGYREGEVVFVCRTSLSLRELDLLLRGVYGRIFLAGLLMAAVAGLIAFFLARRIRIPLLRIDEAAAAFAAGNLDHRLVNSDSAEINAVAAALNNMALQLKDRIETIERQRNELEAFMTSMVEGVVAVDADENVISLNSTAARMLGQDPQRSIGHSIQEIGRHPELTRLAQDALVGTEVQEQDIFLGTARSTCLQATATTLVDKQDNRIGALLVLNDVTTLRRLETVRRDFVANVSHELKTPITSIKGFVETLLEDPPDEPAETTRFLGIINKQTDRLSNIISDLLALSWLEQGAEGAGIEMLDLPLVPLLERVVRDLAARDPELAARVKLDCLNGVRARVNAPLIEQAVSNLVDNALKYSEPETEVRIACQAREGGVFITVVDQGPGIADEHLPRLFERFYRVDKARSRHLGGTGLGLAIVKHITQAHGGRVEVSSQLGVGTTFTMILPNTEATG